MAERAITAADDLAEDTRASDVPTRARVWWLVHQWVGLKLSLFLSFTLLTGTLAVLNAEIDWLLEPSLRVSPSSAPAEPDWAAIVHAATQHPVSARIRGIELPTASAFAARVMIDRKDGYLGFLNAHPATGEIQGEGPWANAARILRNMHRHLNLPIPIGVPIVSSLALLMAVSVVTSFVVYKKWWRGFFRPIRRDTPRKFWGDFHRLAGLWSLWFAALIVLTGIWYLLEATGFEAPRLPRESTAGHDLAPSALDERFAAALAAARRAFPELRIEYVGFPVEGSKTFRFQGQDRAVLVRARANTVAVDPATGEVAHVLHGEELTVHQRISEMADPLHFGYFGGYWTKIPWFLFGALLTALSVSGAVIYAVRLAKGTRTATWARSVAGTIWLGMGRWRWLSVVLIVIALVLMPALFLQRV